MSKKKAKKKDQTANLVKAVLKYKVRYSSWKVDDCVVIP